MKGVGKNDERLGNGRGDRFADPAVYAVIKIAAGVLVLKYGKRYADKVKEEEKR